MFALSKPNHALRLVGLVLGVLPLAAQAPGVDSSTPSSQASAATALQPPPTRPLAPKPFVPPMPMHAPTAPGQPGVPGTGGQEPGRLPTRPVSQAQPVPGRLPLRPGRPSREVTPPAPSAAPNPLKVGMPVKELQSLLGQPRTTADLGARRILFYPECKITVIDDKVAAIQ